MTRSILDSLLEAVCLTVYIILTGVPAIYGLHFYLLMFLAHRRAPAVRESQERTIASYRDATSENEWPLVTTQLPIFNELHVARRVIEATARMDYPSDRHEVQVLDDSTDATRALVDRVCKELRHEGFDVKVVRRPTRQHYKAGALAHGLTTAKGEYVAVFDADFVPDSDFLRNMIPLIAVDERASCVQARWGHLNADENWMTDGIALGIDGHFGVEQGARAWNGLLLNFNGTGGIWRKAAIDDPRVGGWSGDTITEDLDLSYRAQLAGWSVIYCRDIVCPAEVPADISAIKTQQRRWATGSIQTARKLLPAVWRSHLSLAQKLEASFHLVQYGISIFMVLIPLLVRLVLVPLPADKYGAWLIACWILIPFAAAAPSIAYVYARRTLTGEWTSLWRVIRLVVLGLGLSVNNCAAVMAGLFQRGGEFVRTPKSGSTAQQPRKAAYAPVYSNLWKFEILLGCFSMAQWLYFLREDHYIFGSILLLYGVGLTLLGWKSRPRTEPLESRAALKPVEERPSAAG
ncbi:MAG: glycosyltransferase [Planctomycetes bacterium]|nr:glycosyltransferase [Planctomycetota bacterium]